MTSSSQSDRQGRNVISSWALAVAEALDERGIDSHEIFSTAGLDLSWARDPSTRYPADRMTQVYDLAEEASGDPAFGLAIAEHLHPTSLNALGYSLFASQDLKSFFHRIVRYFGVVSTNAVTETETTAGEFRLSMLPATGRSCYAPQDAWLATLLRFIRFIYRASFNPVRVSLRRPRPSRNVDKFDEWFRAPIEFASEKNTLVFNAEDTTIPLPAANAELARQNDQVVMAMLERIDRSDVVTQVRASLISLLPSGECSKANVAMQLNVSERTLQNRLAARDSSYSQLLSETRRELAELYMNQSLHSISEVAFLLGFSEISSFSRAFRAWTGFSPSVYRERHLRRED